MKLGLIKPISDKLDETYNKVHRVEIEVSHLKADVSQLKVDLRRLNDNGAYKWRTKQSKDKH